MQNIYYLIYNLVKRLTNQNNGNSFKSWFLIGNKSDLSDERKIQPEGFKLNINSKAIFVNLFLDAKRLSLLFSSYEELSVRESPHLIKIGSFNLNPS